MKRYAAIVSAALIVGCGEAPKPPSAPQMTGKPATIAATSSEATEPGSTGSAEMTGAAPKLSPLAPGTAVLTPANAKIEFIGTHTGDKPDPRLGGFENFTGKIAVDAESKLPTAVSFDISTESLWTEIGPKLTDHLKSQDFFDVKEFPEIKFQSTQLEVVDAATGKLNITGDLTLHGVTKPISVPVTINEAEAVKTLTATFSIDRTEFGMNFAEDKVDKLVSLTVVIGEKNAPRPKAAEPTP